MNKVKMAATVLSGCLFLASWASPRPARAQEPPGWRLSAANASLRLDGQLIYMNESDMETTRGELMAAEMEITGTVSSPERDVLDLAFQLPYFTTMEGVDDRGREMHFFNAYGVWKLGLGKPSLRFGQFVIPFGNLANYETHTRFLQSLYPQSLGVRIDRGLSLEGLRGNYDYWLAAARGNGPRPDRDDRPLGLIRVGRRFDLPSGILTTGISALYGTEMPRFSVLLDPVMGEEMAVPQTDLMEEVDAAESLDYTDKLRFAWDAEYAAGPNLFRLELLAGGDSDGPVNGQFLQWERALGDTWYFTLQGARWEQPGGNQVRFGSSLGVKLHRYVTLRGAVERRFGYTPMEDNAATTASLQLVLDFPSLWRK